MVEEKKKLQTPPDSKPSKNSNPGTVIGTLESFGSPNSTWSSQRLDPLEELQGTLPQGAIHTGTDAGAAGDEAALAPHARLTVEEMSS